MRQLIQRRSDRVFIFSSIIMLVCGCETPPLPVIDPNLDAEIIEIGPVSGEEQGGLDRFDGIILGGDLAGETTAGSAETQAGIEAGAEAGMEAGSQAGEEIFAPNIWVTRTCEASPTPLQMLNLDQADLQVRGTWSVGGPLSQGEIITKAQSISRRDEYHIITLIGERVEKRLWTGELVWQSEVSGLLTLHGSYDFNGDGAQEILASSLSRVHILSASSGVELWHSSPEEIDPETPLTSIGRVLVEQSGGIPSLYVVDAGCSTAGNGFGVIYEFAQGFITPSLQTPITGPRSGGRCARWHSLQRSEEREIDDLLVMLTDTQGLQGFSARDGRRVLCGIIEGMPSTVNMPHLTVSTPSGRGWVAIIPDELMLLTTRARQPEDQGCLDEENIIHPQWRISLRGVTPLGLVSRDLNEDGFDDLIVNSQRDEMWRISVIDGQTGTLLGNRDHAASYGWVDFGMNLSDRALDLLIALDPDPNLSLQQRWGPLSLEQLSLSSEEVGQATSLNWLERWERPLQAATPYWTSASTSNTSEFQRLTLISGNAGPQLLVKTDQVRAGETPDEDQPLRTLVAITSSGEANYYPFQTALGLIHPLCSVSVDCGLADRILITHANGAIEVLSTDALTPLQLEVNRPSLKLPTGKSSLSFAPHVEGEGTLIVSLNDDGILGAYQLPAHSESQHLLPETASEALLWETESEALRMPGGDTPQAPMIALPPYDPSLSTPSQQRVVVTRYSKHPDSVDYIGYDLLTGIERWRHRIAKQDARSETQLLGAQVELDGLLTQIVFRLERLNTQSALDQLPECEGPTLNHYEGDPFLGDPSCPTIAATPRVIHALEATSGACLWRAVLKESFNCSRPSLQYLNVIDLDHDQTPELYLFETNSIRELNPKTGELIGSGLLPRRPDGRFNAGGWLTEFEGGLLRYGTYGPPDLYAPISRDGSLTPSLVDALWFGEDVAGLRSQSWLLRALATTQQGAWLTLGVGLPLAQYGSTGQLESLRQLITRDETGSMSVKELDEAEALTESPEITHLVQSDDGGLIATTREGGLFILNEQGDFIWGEQFRSSPGLPVFEDWDRDGRPERVISTSDGTIRFYDQNAFEGVLNVWEADCQLTPECSSLEDIDTLEAGHALCVGWTALEGVDGYDVQLQTIGGTPLGSWQPSTGGDYWFEPTPALTPGNRYRIALRGWLIANDGTLTYTNSTISDGFFVTDNLPPTISLSSSSETLERGGVIELVGEASDSVGLAGWYFAVYAENGQHIKTLAASSTTRNELRLFETWSGDDRFGRFVPEGRYLIIFGVTDDAGNRVNAELWVTVEAPE